VSTPLSDDDHLNGCMIALMPTAEDAARLAVPGGELSTDLHLTLMFLGDDAADWSEDQRADLLYCLQLAMGWYDPEPIKANVFGVAHWNGNGEKPSWVWNVGQGPVENMYADVDLTLTGAHEIAMCAVGDMHQPPQIPAQHCPWIPHVCAAYTDNLTMVRTLEDRLGPVTFDRIRVSFGNEDHDFPLNMPEEPGAVTAAGVLRRQPTELEMQGAVDFADMDRRWKGAVDGAMGALASIMYTWRYDLREQIVQAMTSDDADAISNLTLSTDKAEQLLYDAMRTMAQRSGVAMAREVTAQGIDVPEWSVDDEPSLTADIGGTKLLRGVASVTANLLGSNLIQAAKRRAMALMPSRKSPDAVGDLVSRGLATMSDRPVRDAVGGAITAAQNTGRMAVLSVVPQPSVYVASEALDQNTCKPCKNVDGTEYNSLGAVQAAYPGGGYISCQGGGRCRGTFFAVWGNETASANPAIGETMRNEVQDDHSARPEASVTSEALAKGEPSPGTPKDNRLKENQKSKTKTAGEVEQTAAKKGGSDCGPGQMYDAASGKCVGVGKNAAGAETETLEVQGPDPADIGGEQTAPWRGPLTIEGIETGDGREFDADSLTWADLPLPLRWNKEDSHGGQPHTVAVNVGRIDKIWREDSGLIMGEGLLDLSDDDEKKVHGKIEGKFLRGVSVDVDSVKGADMELVWPDQPEGESDNPDPFAQLFAEPEKVVFHKGRIRAATLVDIPAFAEAYIALLGEDGAVVAGGEPIGTAFNRTGVRTRTHEVVAAARPPAGWFRNPDLSVPTGITVTEDGRVYGHAALWGTCHIGQAGVCVTPPREEDHPYFMTGNAWTEDGASVSVGQITVGTNHAPLSYNHRAASDHYDNTGAAVADVVVGNDAHGIWVAGAVRFGTSQEKIHELRAAGQVSGDWRRIGGALRLVGLLAVNVPGFPVPKLRTYLAEGQQFALVASGIPALTDTMSEEELDQWAYRRVLAGMSRRINVTEE
jgi:hypothetical protein